jgi:hypothetical protein
MTIRDPREFSISLALLYQCLLGYIAFLTLMLESTVDDNLTTTQDHRAPVSAALSVAAACFSNSKLT